MDVAGVSVLLVSGQLVFDGETAFAALEIGEEATATYSYSISDGTGGLAMANVDVTFCGSAETIEDICESLPATIDYQIIDGYGNGTTDAFTIRLSRSGDTRLDGLVIEAAYCAAALEPAVAGADFDTAPVLTADLYCTVEDVLATSVLEGQVGINGLDAIDNLD